MGGPTGAAAANVVKNLDGLRSGMYRQDTLLQEEDVMPITTEQTRRSGSVKS